MLESSAASPRGNAPLQHKHEGSGGGVASNIDTDTHKVGGWWAGRSLGGGGVASNIDTDTHKVGGWCAGRSLGGGGVPPCPPARQANVSFQANLGQQPLLTSLPPCLQAGFEPLTERARNLTEVAMVRGAAHMGRQLWAVASNQPGRQARADSPADGPMHYATPCTWPICFPSFMVCSAGEDADGGHRRDAHP